MDDSLSVKMKVSKTYLRDAVDALLKGESVAVEETRPVGCERLTTRSEFHSFAASPLDRTLSNDQEVNKPPSHSPGLGGVSVSDGIVLERRACLILSDAA